MTAQTHTHTIRAILRPAQVHDEYQSSSWRGIFTGDHPVQHTKKARRLLQHIIMSTVPARTANRVLEILDGEVPWPTRGDFMQGMAAVTSKYKADMMRKVRNGCRVYHVLAISGHRPLLQ